MEGEDKNKEIKERGKVGLNEGVKKGKKREKNGTREKYQKVIERQGMEKERKEKL